jgi:hypothetical protein
VSQTSTTFVATPLLEECELTLSKWGLGSPLGLLKLQSSIAGAKTPLLETFFMSLKSYWSVNVKNGLAWAIWTFTSQVMAKRRAGSQTSNLTPDHEKLGIDPTPMCANGVRHTIGKLSMKATSLLQTSSQSKV